jgi:addiction module HigA family antidote
MIRIPTHREPTHPGEMLLEEFLKPMGLSQRELAEGIRVPYQRVNELINGKRGITPGTALRLAKFFGNTPAFWMNLQLRWDLYHALKDEAEALRRIRRVRKEDELQLSHRSKATRPPGLRILSLVSRTRNDVLNLDQNYELAWG